MTGKKSTVELDKLLGNVNPDRIGEFLSDNHDSMYDQENPFAVFMKETIKRKGYSQQTLFIRADMPERYGYKLISGQKHTLQRDVIIRLCLAGEFDLEETNRALKLYGMSQLYSRIPRDAVLISALNSRKHDIDEVNELLETNGFEKLYSFEID